MALRIAFRILMIPSTRTNLIGKAQANNICRTRIDLLELGCRHMVRRILRSLPSLPILPRPRKGRHAPSPRPHGEETRHHRGEERSPAESPRGTNTIGRRAAERRSTEEDVVVLDRQECAVLVGWMWRWMGEVLHCAKKAMYRNVYEKCTI